MSDPLKFRLTYDMTRDDAVASARALSSNRGQQTLKRVALLVSLFAVFLLVGTRFDLGRAARLLEQLSTLQASWGVYALLLSAATFVLLRPVGRFSYWSAYRKAKDTSCPCLLTWILTR